MEKQRRTNDEDGFRGSLEMHRNIQHFYVQAEARARDGVKADLYIISTYFYNIDR